MAILTTTELATYAPALNLDAGAAAAAILKAQLLAEGPKGANRPLSKQPFVETPPVGANGIARLSRWPIDQTAEFKVETRYYSTNRLAYSHSNDWTTLNTGEYGIDYDLYEVYIHGLIGHADHTFSSIGGRGLSQPGVGGYRSRGATSTRRGSYRPQVRITYTAGFDFQATPLSDVAQKLKTALAAIVSIQQSPFGCGLKQERLDEFYTKSYDANIFLAGASAMGTTPLEDFLSLFRQYRASEYTT